MNQVSKASASSYNFDTPSSYVDEPSAPVVTTDFTLFPFFLLLVILWRIQLFQYYLSIH